jgi:ribosomal protein L7/L12
MNFWQVVLAFVAVNVLWSLFFSKSGWDHTAQLNRLERKLDALLAHQGLTEPRPPTVSERVWAQLNAGNRILAIKALREEQPGISLREAKDRIDELALHHPPRWA